MIYTLTLNPSLDYIVRVKDFEMGETNRTYEDEIYPGGKGINVSIVLSHLHQPTAALGFLAGFTGQALLAMVREEGIESRFLQVKEGNTRINVKLKTDVETEINGQGPNITEADIDALMGMLDTLKEDDILVISGSIPSHLPKSLYYDLMKHVEGKVRDIVVDAEGRLLENVLPLHPFLIKPNRAELEGLCGKKMNTLQDVEEGSRMLQEKGARNVLISMGGDGAFLLDENGKTYFSHAPKGKLKNSVGAGDSMVAGFLAGYLESGSFAHAFKMGLCTGSATAFNDGLADEKSVRTLLENTPFDF